MGRPSPYYSDEKYPFIKTIIVFIVIHLGFFSLMIVFFSELNIFGYVTTILFILWFLMAMYLTDKGGRENGFDDMNDMLFSYMTCLLFAPIFILIEIKNIMENVFDRIEPKNIPEAPKRYRKGDDDE